MGCELLRETGERELLLARFETEAAQLLEWLAGYSRKEEPGVTRLLYTEEWLAAQRGLETLMTDMGLAASFDEVGNLFGKLQGSDERALSVVTGSHIDTVVQGGKYDGAYGIVAAIVAVRFLRGAYGRPKRSLEIVSLCEEEGSRFPLAYWGSGSIAGKRNFDQVAALCDIDEIPFVEAMDACGFGKGHGSQAGRNNIGAFIELHIEQGAVLEREGLSAGIVDAIAGQRRLKFEIIGEPNHAGTTPMHMRRDALEGASAMIGRLRQEALRLGPPLVATIGQLQVQPNVSNVVPGKVDFTVDARHADEDELERFVHWLIQSFTEMAADRGLGIRYTEWFREEPVPMDDGLKGKLEQICGELGFTHRRMVSGAGHDAQMFKQLCPTALLFVPSRAGISHSPDEYTSPRELAVGIMILAELLYRLGYEEAQL